MKKKKLLFMTCHLYQGGVDRVAVDIVNGLDKEKYDVTLMVLFKFDPNRFNIDPKVKVKSVFKTYFKGLTKFLMLLPPKLLYKFIVKEKYNYEIAFQAGVPTWLLANVPKDEVKRYAWMHGLDMDNISNHKNYDNIIFVSDEVRQEFSKVFDDKDKLILKYNPLEYEKILNLSNENINENYKSDLPIICTVGRLSQEKGYIRLLECHKNLLEKGFKHYLWFIGDGDLKIEMEKYIYENKLDDTVKLWGFQTNPYKFIKASDIYVCSSFNEGFSIAATEAVLLEKPVVTTQVCGMKELLGESEYGIITQNNTESLCKGLQNMLNEQTIEYYTKKSKIRSEEFCKINKLKLIEELF